MRRNNEEHKIQAAFFEWAKNMAHVYKCLEHCLFAIPNGGARTAITGAMLKSEGVKSGIPDVFLAVPDIKSIPWYHGLFIEFKSQKGKLSDNQNVVISQLQLRGYRVEICRSTQEAIDIVEEYLR